MIGISMSKLGLGIGSRKQRERRRCTSNFSEADWQDEIIKYNKGTRTRVTSSVSLSTASTDTEENDEEFDADDASVLESGSELEHQNTYEHRAKEKRAEIKTRVSNGENEITLLENGWYKVYHAEFNRYYYYDPITKESTWSKPKNIQSKSIPSSVSSCENTDAEEQRSNLNEQLQGNGVEDKGKVQKSNPGGVGIGKRRRSSKVHGHVVHGDLVSDPEPEWTRHYDKRYSRYYYFNTRTKTSTWHNPYSQSRLKNAQSKSSPISDSSCVVEREKKSSNKPRQSITQELLLRGGSGLKACEHIQVKTEHLNVFEFKNSLSTHTLSSAKSALSSSLPCTNARQLDYKTLAVYEVKSSLTSKLLSEHKGMLKPSSPVKKKVNCFDSFEFKNQLSGSSLSKAKKELNACRVPEKDDKCKQLDPFELKNKLTPTSLRIQRERLRNFELPEKKTTIKGDIFEFTNHLSAYTISNARNALKPVKPQVPKKRPASRSSRMKREKSAPALLSVTYVSDDLKTSENEKFNTENVRKSVAKGDKTADEKTITAKLQKHKPLQLQQERSFMSSEVTVKRTPPIPRSKTPPPLPSRKYGTSKENTRRKKRLSLRARASTPIEMNTEDIDATEAAVERRVCAQLQVSGSLLEALRLKSAEFSIENHHNKEKEEDLDSLDDWSDEEEEYGVKPHTENDNRGGKVDSKSGWKPEFRFSAQGEFQIKCEGEVWSHFQDSSLYDEDFQNLEEDKSATLNVAGESKNFQINSMIDPLKEMSSIVAFFL
mmetsp:Transcript_27285/g.33286  ORF Transcript_27285/g.33286 Transcript_27285/m.33286 type:complete len:770 (-) Transcript_27285:892-3201(-)